MYGITILLFTTFFTNFDGIAGAFWEQLDYWLAQQEVQRGTQPFYYYVFMVPLYEFLSLLAALIGGSILLGRSDRLTRLLAFWALGVFLVLSYAGEKMPWLTVHIALPLAILAGYALGRGIEYVRDRARDPARSAGVPLIVAPAALLLGALLLLTLRSGYRVSYDHPDTPIEPLIYTQTSPDIPVITRQLEQIAAERGGYDKVPIIVDSSESMSWPWAWYLRDFTQASYIERIDPATIAEGTILLVWDGTVRGQPSLTQRSRTVEEYGHRWWFPEEGYRSWTAGSLTSRLLNGSLIGDVVEFMERGEDPQFLGTLEGVALFPEEPPQATLPTTGVTYGR
jgi:hypothetical protein